MRPSWVQGPPSTAVSVIGSSHTHEGTRVVKSSDPAEIQFSPEFTFKKQTSAFHSVVDKMTMCVNRGRTAQHGSGQNKLWTLMWFKLSVCSAWKHVRKIPFWFYCDMTDVKLIKVVKINKVLTIVQYSCLKQYNVGILQYWKYYNNNNNNENNKNRSTIGFSTQGCPDFNMIKNKGKIILIHVLLLW